MCDYIADMLTRIRNGQKAKLKEVVLHEYMSNNCIEILKILEREGYILGFLSWNFPKKQEGEKKKAQIKVILKYSGEGKSVIQGIFKISKPGCRVYISTKTLWKPKSSKGMFILSTPFGFLTDREARLLNVGGELICGIY